MQISHEHPINGVYAITCDDKPVGFVRKISGCGFQFNAHGGSEPFIKRTMKEIKQEVLRLVMAGYIKAEIGAQLKAEIGTPPVNQSLSDTCPILFGKADDRVTCLGWNINNINVDALAAEYTRIKENAPVRSRRNKEFFVGHDGIPSTAGETNRKEEHYAIALTNPSQPLCFNSDKIYMLDYQVPLKARAGDKGVGKIDLIGFMDESLVIIELKVGNNKNTPLTALLESLRYAAILEHEKNTRAIIKETRHKFSKNVSNKKPMIWLLAEQPWWQYWKSRDHSYPWKKDFVRLVNGIQKEIGVCIQCIALEKVGLTLGEHGKKPSLDKKPELREVDL